MSSSDLLSRSHLAPKARYAVVDACLLWATQRSHVDWGKLPPDATRHTTNRKSPASYARRAFQFPLIGRLQRGAISNMAPENSNITDYT